jgi:hypothetical protein
MWRNSRTKRVGKNNNKLRQTARITADYGYILADGKVLI